MADYLKALNKLCKWRSVLAGWQLGTRPDSDPETQAVRDHRDQSMILRAEVSALTLLLLEKGIITQAELEEAVAGEAEHLDHAYEKKFPGIRTSDVGVIIDIEEIKLHGTMKGWKP